MRTPARKIISAMVAKCLLLAVLGFLPTTLRSAGPAEVDQPISVKGQVVDENDRPLVDVTIRAGAVGMGQQLWMALSEKLVTRSKGDGSFELALPMREILYSISAERLGYDGADVQFLPNKETAAEPIKLRIRKGLHRDWSGKVIDSDLKTIPDLRLTLVGEYGYSLSTKTDKEGKFHFADVPQYIGQPVMVAHADGQGITQEVVRRAALEGDGLELLLSPAGKIKGVVQDRETGMGVKGAEVTIRPWFASGYSLTAKCDDKGAYQLENVPPGSYLLEASAPAHFDKPPRGMAHERERITVIPGATTTVSPLMSRCAVVKGQVVDRRGEGVSGAIVGMPCTWNGDYRNRVRFVRTDARGQFEIATGHVAEEGMHLSAYSARFGGGHVQLEPLLEDETRGDVRITLPGAVRVKGTVVDERGKGISSVICAAGIHEVMQTTDAAGRFDLGRLTLSPDAGAGMGLALRAPRPSFVNGISSTYGSKIVPDAPAYYEDATQPLDVAADKEIDIKVALKPTDLLDIKGRVVDAEGKGVPAARLYLFSGNADEQWTDQAIPQLGGSRLVVHHNKMLADNVADKEGQFKLRMVRFDGETTENTTRYSIGVVVANRGVKLIKNLDFSKLEKQRELSIKLDK